MNLQKFDKFILYSIILGFLGFLDATYLTILHYKNIIPPCTVSGGCETVLTSKYSMLGPIPVALTGSIFYVLIIILCILVLTSRKKTYLSVFYTMSAVGFLVSAVLIFIQGYLVRAFCQYCLLSEAISTGIVILAFLKFKKDREAKI